MVTINASHDAQVSNEIVSSFIQQNFKSFQSYFRIGYAADRPMT